MTQCSSEIPSSTRLSRRRTTCSSLVCGTKINSTRNYNSILQISIMNSWRLSGVETWFRKVKSRGIWETPINRLFGTLRDVRLAPGTGPDFSAQHDSCAAFVNVRCRALSPLEALRKLRWRPARIIFLFFPR